VKPLAFEAVVEEWAKILNAAHTADEARSV
jgi:hypothetical protein